MIRIRDGVQIGAFRSSEIGSFKFPRDSEKNVTQNFLLIYSGPTTRPGLGTHTDRNGTGSGSPVPLRLKKLPLKVDGGSMMLWA